MTTSYYRRLYAYNRWANQLVIESVSHLSDEEYTRDLGSSFSSVRDTLVHMLAAEWVWLERWNGVSPRSMPGSDAIATLEALRIRWSEVEGEQTAYVENLTAKDLAVQIHYTNTRGEEWEYPLWEMLSHVVNHASYHRGQVATMLRQLRRLPVSTDLLLFSDAAPS